MSLKRAILQMKATEQFFPVVLFIKLYKIGPTSESIDIKYPNDSYWVVLSCGTIYQAVQDSSHFWVCRGQIWPGTCFKFALLSWNRKKKITKSDEPKEIWTKQTNKKRPKFPQNENFDILTTCYEIKMNEL